MIAEQISAKQRLVRANVSKAAADQNNAAAERRKARLRYKIEKDLHTMSKSVLSPGAGLPVGLPWTGIK